MLKSLTVVFLIYANSLAAYLNTEPINYDRPEDYLSIAPSLGDLSAITKLAQKLKANTADETIRNVSEWMTGTLKCNEALTYEWRNFDTVLEQQTYGSCADYAITAGVLLKAADIPTVWVKSMDVEWIWDFKTGRQFDSWSGHVFLEIYLENKWVLFDPTAQRVYKNYKPKMRVLPGSRFSYHKGNNPKAMIMSLQWKQWKEQTIQYFKSLDTALLPVDEKEVHTTSKQAYVLANSPAYQQIGKYIGKFGYHVSKSFNTDLGTYLPHAKGHFLFIETRNGKPIVKIDEIERHYPGAARGLKTVNSPISIGETTLIFIDPARIQ